MTRRYVPETQEKARRDEELDALVRDLDAECREIEAANRFIENPVIVANMNPYLFTAPPPIREVSQSAFRSPYDRQPWQPTQLPYSPPPRYGAGRRGRR